MKSEVRICRKLNTFAQTTDMRLPLLILTIFISCSTYAQDLSLGLRAYYPFTGNANDVSGNGNNPIFNNATLTNDKAGNANSAYHFDGTSSYIQVPNSISLNMGNTMSIAARVRAAGFYTGFCYNNMMVTKGESDQGSGLYSLRFSDQVTGCTANPSNTTEQFYGLNTIATQPYVSLNQWYDVVWTCDGTTSRIYVNCVLQGTGPAAASFSNPFDLYMGKMNNIQYPFWLNGDLDEVRIYDRALTVAEVNLYSGCSVLPVKLTSFTASAINYKEVQLAWTTSEETDVKKYLLERSITGRNEFSTIAEIAPNNNSGENKYSFNDITTIPNISYSYRIRTQTLDGGASLSYLRNAKIINHVKNISVYPNPATEFLNVSFNKYSGPVNISIVNTLGVTTKTSKVNVVSGLILPIDLKVLPAGTYWINIQTATSKVIEKIVKL